MAKRLCVIGCVLLMSLASGKAQSLHTTFADLPCVNKTFNVMVHVPVNRDGEAGLSTEAIQAAFENANQIFEPICLSFRMVKVDTLINYNHGEILNFLRAEEVVNLFSLSNRLNVYFVDEIFMHPAAGLTVGGVLSNERNGLFVRKSNFNTLVHELGIFFGLRPTHGFSPGEELVDGSNCAEAGDWICDTPADPFGLPLDTIPYVIDCEFTYPGLDPNGEYYQPDVGNAMSYYQCPCTGFTRQQFLKMIENYNEAAIRLW